MESISLVRNIKRYSGLFGIHILAIGVADERGFS